MNRPIAIHAITRKEFDQYAPTRYVIATIILQEVEWFVDDERVVIGVVARDRSDNEWSLCVLGPDADGSFRPIAASAGMTSLAEARSRLLVKMETALACGGMVFPGDD